MGKFEIYSLILCLIVFVLLVCVFSYMLCIIFKQNIIEIKFGLEDEKILEEFNTTENKKQNNVLKVFDTIFNVSIVLVFCALFISSIFINCTENIYFDNVATYKVVLTSSMEEKHENNTYLHMNNLNNQISAFDLILIYKIPKEEDLKLYDIVVYEVDGIMVVHRIVGIEEPNQYHPNERHFQLQGDAVGSPDRFPVLYSQMKGIYKGEKIPFIGSFIVFMQSPAGWLCILLVVAAIIVAPILDKKLLNARRKRYEILVNSQENATNEIAEKNEVVSESINNNSETNESIFDKFKSSKTFYEKLEIVSEQMRNRYFSIVDTLSRIEGIRIIKGKKQHVYKYKSICIARLYFKGKTLNVCLNLNPKDYEDSKYIYIDLSEKKKFKNYPMCLKQTSQRQTHWTCDLIMQLTSKYDLTILENPNNVILEVSRFEHLQQFINRKTFEEKLNELPIAKARFDILNELLLSIKNIRVIKSKYKYTYKIKNNFVAIVTIKGKTLNVYLNLNPNDYLNSKYIFTDVSYIKRYFNCPMRIKVSSDRQVKRVTELIGKIEK